GLGVRLGQVLGGVIVTLDLFGLSWRPAFLINVPIGIVLLLVSGPALPATRGAKRRKLDIGGVILLSVTMVLLVVPLLVGRQVDWAIWTWVSLALGAAGSVAFVYLEQAIARRGGAPLVNFDAVRGAGARPGLLVIFLGFVGYGGLLFSMAVYLQSDL